jgi:hypothetical protein
MSKSILKTIPPRNPLVAAARFRQAGRHGAGPGAERRGHRQALRRELDRLDPPRDVRGEPPGF